jgi:DnaJ like chaperone protein
MLGFFTNKPYQKAILERLSDSEPACPSAVAVVPTGGRTEQLLTSALFGVMGRVAKLDGLVTAVEVNFASSIMQKMGLDGMRRQLAISYFEQGKRVSKDVVLDVKQLASNIGARSELSYLFLKIQCRNAYAKGEMRLREKMLLREVAETLGYDKSEFLAVCAEVLASSDNALTQRPNSLRNAYTVLQLQPRVADGEIRRAYLKLISRYHPDKLMRTLSPEATQQAQEKFLAIRNAYETICGFRKSRV